MNIGLLMFSALLSIVFMALAWQLYKMAAAEKEKTKEWPAFIVIMIVVMILLSMLSICAAFNMQ